MKFVKGFSLIEGALSIALIGVGVAGVIQGLPDLIRSSMLADQTVVATNLARETMEKIIAQRDCNDALVCGYWPTVLSVSLSVYDQNPVTGFAGYSIDSSVLGVNSDNDNSSDDFLDSSFLSSYSRITVQVRWNNNNNSIQLVTLLAEY